MQELKTGVVPLLIPTPNASNEVGYNQDRYLLNPALTSEDALQMFKFLGILLGVAVRTKKPLDLHLAPLVWRQLAGMPLSVQELEEVCCGGCFRNRSVVSVLSGSNDNNCAHVICRWTCCTLRTCRASLKSKTVASAKRTFTRWYH